MTDLYLFDIDGTLISTGGVGMLAMEEAGRELYGLGYSIEGAKYAGRLDPLIISDLFGMHGIEDTAAERARYRDAYARALRRRLEAGDWRVPKGERTGQNGALPGVHRLLDRLFEMRPASLGILTGNFRETGAAKLRACGIEPDRFDVTVWGDESPHVPCAREHLPPLAIERFAATYGRGVDPERVIVIGDTPHDVACAKVNGCRALGVGTGRYAVEDLLDAGADHAVADLSGTEEVLAWLTQPPGRRRSTRPTGR